MHAHATHRTHARTHAHFGEDGTNAHAGLAGVVLLEGRQQGLVDALEEVQVGEEAAALCRVDDAQPHHGPLEPLDDKGEILHVIPLCGEDLVDDVLLHLHPLGLLLLLLRQPFVGVRLGLRRPRRRRRRRRRRRHHGGGRGGVLLVVVVVRLDVEDRRVQRTQRRVVGGGGRRQVHPLPVVRPIALPVDVVAVSVALVVLAVLAPEAHVVVVSVGAPVAVGAVGAPERPVLPAVHLVLVSPPLPLAQPGSRRRFHHHHGVCLGRGLCFELLMAGALVRGSCIGNGHWC